MNVKKGQAGLALLMIVVISACRTVDAGRSSAEQIAKTFAPYYANLHQSPGKMLHIQAKNPEAIPIVRAMTSAFHAGIEIRTNGRYQESTSGVIDVDTGRDCVAIGIALYFESKTEALVDVTWSSGTRNWSLITYVITLENGIWKVTGYELGAIS